MTAQLSVVVEYGSKSDPEKNAGLAHFLEHMLSGGSKERTKISRSIEQNGGYMNFSTGYGYTLGIADILPEKLDEASKILSKLFFEHGFEEKKIDLERKVILNEIAESSDDPWNVTDNMLRKNLYKTHPIRHPILGYHKTVSQLSINDLEQAHQIYYNPQNTILILSGNFSNKDIETVVQDFVEIKKSKTKLKKYNCIEKGEPEKLSSKTKTGICQTYLDIGYRTVSGNHTDFPVLEIFSAIIGVGASSRLFRELREKRALTYGVQSSNCNGLDFGFFSIYCAIKSSKLKETTDLILKEITALKNKKVSEDELLKGKNMVIGDLFRDIDDSSTLHTRLAYMEILFGAEYALPKYLENIKLVSVDDLIDVANKHLDESNFSKVVLTPEKRDTGVR
jgi:predicted Zn-dependent peptidase